MRWEHLNLAGPIPATCCPLEAKSFRMELLHLMCKGANIVPCSVGPVFNHGIGGLKLWAALPLLFHSALCLPCMYLVGVAFVTTAQCLYHGFLLV